MNKITFSFPTLKNILLSAIIIIFPIFFLPLTQEYFSTAKAYFLTFGVLLLLLTSTIEFLITKKFNWQKNPFDNLLILFIITTGLSIVISSPNKIQAILNPNFGLVSFIALSILTFYFLRSNSTPLEKNNFALLFSAIFLSLISIVIFFIPFINFSPPSSLLFLKSSSFTPLGNQIDLAIYLGFFILYGLTQILSKKQTVINKKQLVINYLQLISSFIALSFVVYSLFNQFNQSLIILPPFKLSWYAVLEILKNPVSALFGAGVDNFSSIFTKVKDIDYNQTKLWQISSFSVSRSTIFHLFTETGIFGFISFVLLIFTSIKQSLQNKQKYFLFTIGYWVLVAFLFPPSLPLFFLFFFILSQNYNNQSSIVHSPSSNLDLSGLLPIYLGTIIISFIIIGASSYFLTTTYYAEILYRKSLNALAGNNVQGLYNDMRQAIAFNPFIEKYRVNFSQVNLLIANNVAAKANDKYQLTDQDRQTISQAIQTAISEAKAGVTLNSQKSNNWENLAYIYKNIINIAQDADSWTVAAYQRAIALDPQNPTYKLNFGGVYYSFNNFEMATNLFQQAIALKPDWANAHYNLAWSNFNKQNYQSAAAEMQNVLYLLNPQKDKIDYDKAQKDLEEFKKKLPQTEEPIKPEVKEESKQLNLPIAPKEKIEPPIQLPKEASPEAR